MEDPNLDQVLNPTQLLQSYWSDQLSFMVPITALEKSYLDLGKTRTLAILEDIAFRLKLTGSNGSTQDEDVLDTLLLMFTTRVFKPKVYEAFIEEVAYWLSQDGSSNVRDISRHPRFKMVR